MNDYSHVNAFHTFCVDRHMTCVSCGEKKQRSDFPVLANKNVSGDKMFPKVIRLASTTCSACHSKRFEVIKHHPLYSVRVHKFCRAKMATISGGALGREIDMLVTEIDILQKLLDQKGKCALSGVTMTYESGLRKRSNTIASLDRIDSHHPYTPDNIQWLCAVVNVMKNDLQQTDFLQWCSKVVDHRRAVEDDLLSAMS